MHIVLVAGLPGSGKTTWCERVAQNRAGCVVVDDPSRDASRFDQIGPDTKIVLIADPHLCMMNGPEAKSWVQKFWAPHESATWHGLWFDNDPKTSAAHARPKTDNFIQIATRHYVVPSGAVTTSWGALRVSLEQVLAVEMNVQPLDKKRTRSV